MTPSSSINTECTGESPKAKSLFSEDDLERDDTITLRKINQHSSEERESASHVNATV